MKRSKGPHGRGPRPRSSTRPAPNSGWFAAGPDPRRHQLTAEEKRRGGVARGLQQLAEVAELVYGSARTEEQAAELGQLRELARIAPAATVRHSA